MALNNKQKKQLTISVGVMILALIALIAGVVAWMMNNHEAKVSSLTMTVERQEIELESEITTVQFPCATKFLDAEMTADIFNNRCAVVKQYVIKGEGALQVNVDCTGGGMLGYVCMENDTTDVYGEIVKRLCKTFGVTYDETKTAYDLLNNVSALQDNGVLSFEKLQSAIAQLNQHAVDDTIDDGNGGKNTVVNIVYWVEYDKAESSLFNDSYWSSTLDENTASNSTYYATVTFTGKK